MPKHDAQSIAIVLTRMHVYVCLCVRLCVCVSICAARRQHGSDNDDGQIDGRWFISN